MVKKSVGYAARCIEHYEYRKAFTFLYNNFAGAKRALNDLIEINIRKEVSSYLKKDSALSKDVTIDNIKKLKWKRILKEAETDMPLLFTSIKSAITTKKNEEDLLG